MCLSNIHCEISRSSSAFFIHLLYCLILLLLICRFVRLPLLPFSAYFFLLLFCFIGIDFCTCCCTRSAYEILWSIPITSIHLRSEIKYRTKKNLRRRANITKTQRTVECDDFIIINMKMSGSEQVFFSVHIKKYHDLISLLSKLDEQHFFSDWFRFFLLAFSIHLA